MRISFLKLEPPIDRELGYPQGQSAEKTGVVISKLYSVISRRRLARRTSGSARGLGERRGGQQRAEAGARGPRHGGGRAVREEEAVQGVGGRAGEGGGGEGGRGGGGQEGAGGEGREGGGPRLRGERESERRAEVLQEALHLLQALVQHQDVVLGQQEGRDLRQFAHRGAVGVRHDGPAEGGGGNWRPAAGGELEGIQITGRGSQEITGRVRGGTMRTFGFMF